MVAGEIRTDNTETLANALERIAGLEKESIVLKGQFLKAKNHIHRLLVLLTEGKRSYAAIDEARAFLQEVSE